MLGPGVYLTRNKEKALDYSKINGVLDRKGPLIEVRADVGECVVIDHVGHRNDGEHPLITSWHQHNYDAAWVPANVTRSGREENCIWDPRRIRIIRRIQ